MAVGECNRIDSEGNILRVFHESTDSVSNTYMQELPTTRRHRIYVRGTDEVCIVLEIEIDLY